MQRRPEKTIMPDQTKQPSNDDKISALADAVTKLASRVDGLRQRLDDDAARRHARRKNDENPSELATPHEQDLTAEADDDDRRDDCRRGDDKDLDIEEWAEEEKQEPQHKTRTDTVPAYDPARPERMASDDARPRRDDRRRADSARRADEDQRIDAQFEFDKAFQAVRGERAPQATYGETCDHYIRRMLRPLQRFSADWKDKDISRLSPEVLSIASKQIRADAWKIGSDPQAMQQFEGGGPRLREVITTDRAGRRISNFYGPVSETLDPFSLPAFRVKKFNTHPDR
jgi:hypothetical protein